MRADRPSLRTQGHFAPFTDTGMRKLISLTLTISLFFLLTDALVLYFAPDAATAAWGGWSVLGLSRARWAGMHVTLGLLVLGCALWHLTLNWRAVTGYLRGTSRQLSLTSPAALGALALVLFVQVGTLFGLPPMQQILDIAQYAHTSFARANGEAPYPGAELSPLDAFVRRTGLDPVAVQGIFAARGVRVESPGQTVADIAKANGLSPAELFDVARGKTPAAPKAQAAKTTQGGLPLDPPPGLGTLKLADVAEQYGLDLEAMLRLLSAKGIKSSAGMTVRDAAALAGVQTYDVYEIMRQAPVKTAAAPTQAPQTAPLTPQPQTPQAAIPATQGLQAQPPQVPAPPQAPVLPAPTAPVVQTPAEQPQAPALPSAQAQPGAPRKAPPEDYQRIFLSQLATHYGLSTAEAISRLEAKRFSAFGDMTIREIALENDATPDQVLAIVAAGQ